VGQASSPLGMPEEAPTIATVLKSMDYATGQFGKMTSTNFYRPFLASTSSMATSITLMPWKGGTQMTEHTAPNADHILQTNVPMRAVTALIVLQQLVFVVSVKIWGTLSDRFFEQSSAIDKPSPGNRGIAAWSFTTFPDRYALSVPLLIAIQIATGFSLSAIPLSITNLALKQSPPGLTHAYMTMADLAGAPSGAIAPLLGGWMMDFFAKRHFALILQWTNPINQFSVRALSIRGLDFVFLVSAAAGLVAAQWLALIPKPWGRPQDFLGV
jgi:hypothetical protein